jgi:Dynactin subunit p22
VHLPLLLRSLSAEQLEARAATLKTQLLRSGTDAEEAHTRLVRLLSAYNDMVAQLSVAFVHWNQALDARLLAKKKT